MLMCLTAFCWHAFLFPPCYTSPLFHSRATGPLIITEWNGMDWLIPASNSIKASVAALPLIVLCCCGSFSFSLELSRRLFWRLCSQCLHPCRESPSPGQVGLNTAFLNEPLWGETEHLLGSALITLILNFFPQTCKIHLYLSYQFK